MTDPLMQVVYYNAARTVPYTLHMEEITSLIHTSGLAHFDR